VLPFPRSSGQQQRVFYTIQAAREFFEVTFATSVVAGRMTQTAESLSAICDCAILLPSLYSRSVLGRVRHKALGLLHAARTGLKQSNYVIGHVEFSPSRVASLLESSSFDCVLFEYWHAAASARVFRDKGIPCALDMHDVLWQDYQAHLKSRPELPVKWRGWALDKYKAEEERSWREFDALIAINREEARYVQERIPETTRLFYAPMGTDLSLWAYSWNPVRPVRVAYYGGLGSPHNQKNALTCHRSIMPRIWAVFPDAELWLVGSNPPRSIRALSVDARVKVTGYVEDVRQVLSTMSVALCPWAGTYGFRSRLVEVMALGVPVVASPDAIYGMELDGGRSVTVGNDEEEMATRALHLLNNGAAALEQSRLARERAERVFSIDGTYRRLARELRDWLQTRNAAEDRRRVEVLSGPNTNETAGGVAQTLLA
jgi:glycosyltransferase involved in cell wall biosynthesis